ncbi:MAG: hypothetical protein GXO92_00335 [FCB group bacterium]|nr:hypothetical protein [FCB group bacterium]
MKLNSLFIFFGLLTIAYSQEQSSIDTLLTNQEQLLLNQKQILEEVKYIDPLEGKKFGIEINPVMLLLSTSLDDKSFILTGTYSLFSVSKSAEIAFPFYFAKGDNDLSVFHLDGHYRYFLGKHRKGFYISCGVRFTSLAGEEGHSFWEDFDDGDELYDYSRTSKAGLTFGIGYRIFGRNGWYWGVSLFGGRYLIGKKTDYYGAGMANGNAILDMELFKIGKTF